ncbi:MAG TPA: MFS transporter [Phycisphaerales bacterium]|nr:MFS transporter [Phycisphaerales bacterium]
MPSLLIGVIYLAFISMGLPDVVLGSAWPAMRAEMGVPLSYAGMLSVLMSAGTVVSSLQSQRLVARFGTGPVTIGCTALTALALFGFATSSSFWQLCLWAVPYGLGAGSIDAALNNFVALHYKSRHMSWIHFSWGVGAATGPAVMGYLLTHGHSWNSGYATLGAVQVVMCASLLLTLPMWKRAHAATAESVPQQVVPVREALRIRGVRPVLVAFFCYCAIESTAGMWASSYMQLHRGIEAKSAATWAAYFYVGITLGRFALGFVADRFGNRNMVRGGQVCALVGVALLLLAQVDAVTLAGLVLVGVGCAPIYPSLLHATPTHFGAANSQALMGVQMACAYTGSTLVPPAFGVLAERTDIAVYPWVLLALVVTMVVMTERVNGTVANK